MRHGLNGLLDDLRETGTEPVLRHGLIVFTVIPVAGVRARIATETGIAESEAHGWPLTPPHWIHLPGDIRFVHTNAQASTHPGWLMHSRNLEGWASETLHGIAWVAHVRSVLAGAL